VSRHDRQVLVQDSQLVEGVGDLGGLFGESDRQLPTQSDVVVVPLPRLLL
jgi:hypothetical protein